MLTKAAKSSAEVRDGKAWLEYGRTFKIFSFVLALIPCELSILCFFVDANDRFAILMMILLFGVLSIPLFIEAFFVKIAFDDSTVYCYSSWRSSRQIKFCDIGEPEFSESLQWWVIPTKTQGKIRIQPFISGAPELLKKLEKSKK
ncbi:MAG: hypothetical protein ACI86H_001829 [bacterium]|jgi:hypothetical protein